MGAEWECINEGRENGSGVGVESGGAGNGSEGNSTGLPYNYNVLKKFKCPSRPEMPAPCAELREFDARVARGLRGRTGLFGVPVWVCPVWVWIT